MAKDFDCNKCYHSEVCAYKMTFKDTIKSCNEYIPTADVVEVVRCEKCKYLKHTRGHIPYCKRMDEYADGDNLYEVSYDDFCSYGERIDNNG